MPATGRGDTDWTLGVEPLELLLESGLLLLRLLLLLLLLLLLESFGSGLLLLEGLVISWDLEVL